MINTMTPPVLWPEFKHLAGRLATAFAERRARQRARLVLDNLSDRMLRDIGIPERGPRSLGHSPQIRL